MMPLDLPTTVEARFESSGAITPLRFTLMGRPRQVKSVGRSWDVEGEGRHILVMAGHDHVYELLLRTPTLDWRIIGMSRIEDAIA